MATRHPQNLYSPSNSSGSSISTPQPGVPDSYPFMISASSPVIPAEQEKPSPVSCLPPELMTHIFKFLTNRSDRYTTLFVCKYWFNLSIDTFWMRPNFVKEKQVKRVQEVLKRARLGQSTTNQDIFNLSETSAADEWTPSKHDSESPQPARPITENSLTSDGVDIPANNEPAPQQPVQQDPVPDQDLIINIDEDDSESSDAGEAAVEEDDEEEEDPLTLIPLTVPYHLMIKRVNLTSVTRFVTDEILIQFAVCENLERLTLGGCSRITDKSLIPLITSCTRILSVDLSNLERVTDATFKTFATHCTRLQAIYATHCKELTDEGVLRLANACPSLKRVKFTSCVELTDVSILALIDKCPALVELDLSNVPCVTNAVLTQALLKLPQLRELKLAMNVNINDNAILEITDPDGTNETNEPLPPILGGPQQPFFLNPPNALLPTASQQQQQIWGNQNTTGSSLTGSTTPSSSISIPMFDKLRIIDFSNCALITDITIKKIVPLSPRLRNVTLAKCSNITDRALVSLAALGRNLHYIHLGHCSNITNRGVSTLVKACTRIEYIDVASCNQLTDAAVKDLAALPKLRRVGLVKCQQITDASIHSFAQRGYTNTPSGTLVHTDNPLERVHLSYCSNITVGAITQLLNACPKLTHLSLSGVPSFLVHEVRQFCRAAPEDFTQHQQSIFCVFSSNGVKDLRNYLNLNQAAHRTQNHLEVQQQRITQMVNDVAAQAMFQPTNQRFLAGPALFDSLTGLLIEFRMETDTDGLAGIPPQQGGVDLAIDRQSIQSALQSCEIIRRQVLAQRFNEMDMLQQQQLAIPGNFDIIPPGAARPRHNVVHTINLARPQLYTVQPQQQQQQRARSQTQIFQNIAAQGFIPFQPGAFQRTPPQPQTQLQGQAQAQLRPQQPLPNMTEMQVDPNNNQAEAISRIDIANIARTVEAAAGLMMVAGDQQQPEQRPQLQQTRNNAHQDQGGNGNATDPARVLGQGYQGFLQYQMLYREVLRNMNGNGALAAGNLGPAGFGGGNFMNNGEGSNAPNATQGGRIRSTTGMEFQQNVRNGLNSNIAAEGNDNVLSNESVANDVDIDMND